ncbi:hypothetical protein DITRI_Ditri07aG0124600 [Diplodiscus trichospermus]
MEQTEVTETDVEKKVERILKLIKRRNRAKKEPELVGLDEDFHKQYQSVYAKYDHLKRESDKKAVDGKGNESCSYDASGSDSEYYSSEDVEINTNIACKSTESFDQANLLKQEFDSLRNQQTESQFLLERKSKEISQYLIQLKTVKEELARKSAVEQIMVEEKEDLQVQVMELESEVDALCKQKNKLEDEKRSDIHEINQLTEEKSHLHAKILELEAVLRETGLELSAIQDIKSKRIKEPAHIMTLNTDAELLQQKLYSMKMDESRLALQIADQQRITKEKESSNNSMESNFMLARRLSSGNLNLHVLERKMEDLAQEFRKKVEDNIHLLNQRITVAEKMHFENKDIYKKIKRLEQENVALGEKLATCEVEFRKLRDSMVPDRNAASNCDTGRENEMQLLAEIDKEKREFLWREKGEEEKVKLLKAVTELENRVGELEKITKEKDETLLGREEEKREAIRQLCLLIDYHRSRCDHFKELISNLAVRSKKKT